MDSVNLSTGLPGFDRVIRRVLPGDNIVWQIDTIDDYRPFADVTGSLRRLACFLSACMGVQGRKLRPLDDKTYELLGHEGTRIRCFTLDREEAARRDDVELLGLDHPLIARYLKTFRDVPPDALGLRVTSPDGKTGTLAAWLVEARGEKGQIKRAVIPLAVDAAGSRIIAWERNPEKLWRAQPAPGTPPPPLNATTLHEILEPMLQKELEYRGLASGTRGYEAKLIAWISAE